MGFSVRASAVDEVTTEAQLHESSVAWRVFAFLFCDGSLGVEQATVARRASSACEVDSDG